MDPRVDLRIIPSPNTLDDGADKTLRPMQPLKYYTDLFSKNSSAGISPAKKFFGFARCTRNCMQRLRKKFCCFLSSLHASFERKFALPILKTARPSGDRSALFFSAVIINTFFYKTHVIRTDTLSYSPHCDYTFVDYVMIFHGYNLHVF